MNVQCFDYVILGAGINGSAIARELAYKNKSVLVLDKSTIGSGTSSKSSRLVHGGLRYLENLDIFLVREALKDRALLVSLYSDIVKMSPFYLPVYKHSCRSPMLLYLGLKLYDILGSKAGGYGSLKVSADEFSEIFPNIRTEDILTAYRFYDAKTDDLALTKRVATDAIAKGAEFIENSEIHEIAFRESIDINTSKGLFQTKNMINATGPWIDEINVGYNLPCNYKITKISGIHIEVGKKIVPHPLVLQAQTKRIFFIIPEDDTTIVGTTERVENVECDKVELNNSDIEYLLENLNSYLKLPVNQGDIIKKWIGIRPLIESKENLSMISRGYKLDLHRINENKLLHVFGGKLTTCLSLAKRAVDILEAN